MTEIATEVVPTADAVMRQIRLLGLKVARCWEEFCRHPLTVDGNKDLDKIARLREEQRQQYDLLSICGSPAEWSEAEKIIDQAESCLDRDAQIYPLKLANGIGVPAGLVILLFERGEKWITHSYTSLMESDGTISNFGSHPDSHYLNREQSLVYTRERTYVLAERNRVEICDGLARVDRALSYTRAAIHLEALPQVSRVRQFSPAVLARHPEILERPRSACGRTAGDLCLHLPREHPVAIDHYNQATIIALVTDSDLDRLEWTERELRTTGSNGSVANKPTPKAMYVAQPQPAANKKVVGPVVERVQVFYANGGLLNISLAEGQTVTITKRGARLS